MKSVGDDNTTYISAFGASRAPDAVNAALNPLGGLRSAGVGWLVDHVDFLREPLDLLMGDDKAVRSETEKIAGDAEKYEDIASAHLGALRKLDAWTGTTADAFKTSMTQVGHELQAIGLAMRGSADIMATMGTTVTAFRALVRETVVNAISDLISGAHVAAGLAPSTYGASIVAFVGTAVAAAREALVRILRHITDLRSLLLANRSAADELGKALAKIGADGSRFDKAAPRPVAGVPPLDILHGLRKAI
ncbi:hypothetical protein [Umezawaea sp. Da 62-37]|uniref:hypothetical protein n=1 Tax=Umezawaea sp. Da 62-37 TaxID=3075927 RepID=UPI0028F74831|nr:hypothetical protein [Umezawaea sp. Da 62-37]WNV82146.1 hypothetical protein RM788_28485 [Umezawaea sp. Da 62-37]